MENCIFCKIIKKEIPSEIIWEDANFLAFLDVEPINEGHTLIIPKDHIDYVFDLDQDKYTELFLSARKLAGPLKEATNAKRIGMIVEGFGVPHCHLHLVPINQGNELDPKRAHEVSPEELKVTAQKIRNLL